MLDILLNIGMVFFGFVVLLIMAVMLMATITVIQEHRRKMKLKNSPKTDAEFEQRATQLLAQLMASQDARTREQIHREGKDV